MLDSWREGGYVMKLIKKGKKIFSVLLSGVLVFTGAGVTTVANAVEAEESVAAATLSMTNQLADWTTAGEIDWDSSYYGEGLVEVDKKGSYEITMEDIPEKSGFLNTGYFTVESSSAVSEMQISMTSIVLNGQYELKFRNNIDFLDFSDIDPLSSVWNGLANIWNSGTVNVIAENDDGTAVLQSVFDTAGACCGYKFQIEGKTAAIESVTYRFDVTELVFSETIGTSTEAPVETSVPTETPTIASTETPTIAPTETPTIAPVETPTEAPGEMPTETPVEETGKMPEETLQPSMEPIASASPDVLDPDGLIVKNVGAKYKKIKKSGYLYVPQITVTWDDNDGCDGYEIWRRTGSDKDYEQIDVIEDNETSTFIDRSLQKGTTYVYQIIAYAEEEDGEQTMGPAAVSKSVTVDAKFNVPSFKVKKHKKKITLTFMGAEGEGYQAQYSHLNGQKWRDMTKMKGELKKKITKTCNLSKFRFRVRTYSKINGKKVYSKWSKEKTVR